MYWVTRLHGIAFGELDKELNEEEIKMTLPNGYEMTTTFESDFRIADKFGIPAIKDTFQRAFAEWKNDPVYLSELSVICNYSLWHYYEMGNMPYAELYEKLWIQCENEAYRDDQDPEFIRKYFEITD